ncbi:hypothetical protein HRbin23_00096 [bacterium HR23]|nr:hypothetical protein HRbin23_00096 [bacterium HR23]
MGVHRQIPDAFPRQGKVLGEGGRNDSAGVKGEDIGNLHPVVDQLAVWFIAEQVDGAPEAGLSPVEHPRHLPEGVGGVDHPCGVIGGVEDKDTSARRQGALYLLRVGLERRIGGDDTHHTPVVVHIEGVFGEEGGQQEHLIPRVQQGLEGDIHRSARPAGHYYIAGSEGETRLPAQVVGHGGAGFRKAGVGHVAMEARRRGLGYLPKKALKGLRRLQDGVTQGEVKDLVGAVKGFQACPLLKHPPYPGALLHRMAHLLGDSGRGRACLHGAPPCTG